MDNSNQQKYNLFTAISMIVGIVIGSGIFFKVDNILVLTQGSVKYGVFAFLFAAISIIFGCLTLSQLAARTKQAGGVISYMEDSWSAPAAGAFGWFHTVVYYATLIPVVAWVAGIYICILFGLEGTFALQMGIGFICMLSIYAINIFSARIAGLFQISTTIIKLIPLFLLGIMGFIFGDPVSTMSSGATMSSTVEGGSLFWISAIVPIAFSFDGWIVSTSISHEIKKSERNLPIALIISPIFIFLAYVLYFVGVSSLVGPENVIALQDGYVDSAANILFGNIGAKFVLVCVVISVLGTLNGLTLGSIRLPHSLALRGMFPMSEKIKLVNEKSQIPLNAAFVSLTLSIMWFVIHYLTQTYNLLPNSDVSEIAVCFNYLCFIFLYIAVIKLYKNKEIKSVFLGVVSPILATIGSLIIFIGAFVNKLVILYVGFSTLVIIIAFIYCKKKLK